MSTRTKVYQLLRILSALLFIASLLINMKYKTTNSFVSEYSEWTSSI